MYSPEVRIDIPEVNDITTFPERDPWKILEPLWKRMRANTFLTGMGSVNKYIVYALSAHVLRVQEHFLFVGKDLMTLDERLRRLEDTVFS